MNSSNNNSPGPGRPNNLGPLSTVPTKNKSGKNFQQHSGRRLFQKEIESNNDQKSIGSSTNASGQNNNIDRLIEEDSLALLSIKKEITNMQKNELSKLQSSLLQLQHEYDQLYTSNNLNEKQLKAVLDKVHNLKELDEAAEYDTEIVKDNVQSVMLQVTEVLDELQCEQRSFKMQTHMIDRIKAEISDCRVEMAKATVLADQAKHDYGLVLSSVQSNKQDLLEDEKCLEKLLASMKQKNEQREIKLNMLHSISIEGENSVAKIQSVLFANSPVQPVRIRTASGKRKVKTPLGTSGQATDIFDDEFDVEVVGKSDLAAMAKKITILELKEAVQRFKSQTQRMDKLGHLDEDLRKNIAIEQDKKKVLSEQYGHCVLKIAQLASNRQVYQEVDMKDSALAATSKQCEDCKERDFRLKVQIEELKLSIPRFLTKVTKVSHPKPTESQLGDAVMKLEEELVKLIKLTGSALLKDATPDDLAMLSSQQPSIASISSDANSEFSRLQRMPGYSRLQRQLFYNLMTAKPDTHIRVDNEDIRALKFRQPKTTGGGMIVGNIDHHHHGGGHSRRKPHSGPGDPEDDEGTAAGVSGSPRTMEERTNAALDRSTIKNISKLIYERDSGKAYPPNNSNNNNNNNASKSSPRRNYH